MQWLKSFVCTMLLFANTFLFGVIVMLSAPFGLAASHACARAWARSNLWMLRVLCGLDYVVEGLENIPREGAHISYWKHTSAWETMAQMLIFPPQSWVLKREIMWIPLVGWGTAVMRPIAINRSAGHRAVNQVVEQGRKRLAEGLWILLFPEGTRVLPGQTRKYGLSGALLASQTGARLVPGADLVFGLSGFGSRLARADLVLTGEGKLDAGTAMGKLVARVADRARRRRVPALAFAGRIDLPPARVRALGLSGAFPIAPPGTPTAVSVRRAAPLLSTAVERALRARFRP